MNKKTINHIDKLIESCSKDCSVLNNIAIVPKRDGQKTYYVGKSFDKILGRIIRSQFNNIRKAFDLDDTEQMRKLFHDAVCGNGNEWMEINQLNSSALLSFLCFCRVSSDRHITIGEEEYDQVMFEVRSPLEKVGRNHPVSNMDVVLLNDNSALFVESKFSEYLAPKDFIVSPYYNKYYGEIFADKLTFSGFKFIENEHKWEADKNGEYKNGVYLEGIKQMISHYLGLRYSSKDRDKWCGGLFKDKKIKLAEILYKFGANEDAEEFESYAKASRQIFSRLSQDAKENGIEIFMNILTYQEVFSDVENASLLLESVGKFYKLGEYCSAP